MVAILAERCCDHWNFKNFKYFKILNFKLKMFARRTMNLSQLYFNLLRF
jgi:hypothetical protein